MFTRIAITALTLTALGAGAFAVAASEPANQESAAAEHMTVLQKNQVWPVKGNITMNPCAQVACEEV